MISVVIVSGSRIIAGGSFRSVSRSVLSVREQGRDCVAVFARGAENILSGSGVSLAYNSALDSFFIDDYSTGTAEKVDSETVVSLVSDML
jgi:hypothetical protein